jgi:predicted methyltransferase
MKSVTLLAAFSYVLLWPSAVIGQSKPMTMEEMHRLHQDPNAYVAMLDDPARDAYQKPHDVVMALGLTEGERVADIGSGSGYFTLRFASHVGKTGVVYAVDVSPDMIVHLNRRIRDTGVDNVRTILAPPDDPLLPDHSVHLFFICETWHHIENRSKYLALMRRMLDPGGQVVVVDFQAKPTPVGPPPEMRVRRDDVVNEFRAAGYRLVREPTFLPYQYFLAFELGA